LFNSIPGVIVSAPFLSRNIIAKYGAAIMALLVQHAALFHAIAALLNLAEIVA
jgi:hypothetical protein